MFGKLFKKLARKSVEPHRFIVAQLNARIQPMHRGEFFEDPLAAELKKHAIGIVSGGGTMQNRSGEIEYCDIEIELSGSAPETLKQVVEILESLGAPKGSKLKLENDGSEVAFGVCEGLAVYLNGTELAPEVYEACDSNFVYSELDRLLEGAGRVLSYWQGPTDTAFYLYGASASAMRGRISDFLGRYPLCQDCRIEQIA